MEGEAGKDVNTWKSALPLSNILLSSRLSFQIKFRLRCFQLRLGLILRLAPTLLLSIALAFTAQRETVEDYLAEARQLENKQDYDGAIKVYQQALRTFTNHPELLKRLGIAYQTELKFAESIQALQKVVQLNPQYPEANFYLGVSFLGYNDYGRALFYFNQELRFHPDYGRAHFYAAKALLAQGKAGEAVQHYEALSHENPNDARVWFELASLYRSLAVHAFKRLAVLDPDSFMLDILRAEADSDDSRYESAVKRFKEALRKQPDFPGLHFSLGQVYFKMNQPAEAESELRLALKEDPSNPAGNYMLGQILLHKGRPEQALPFLQIAVNGDPESMQGHLELGKCYLQLYRLAEARETLRKAAEADPHSPEPHALLVQVYTRLKDEAKRQSELALLRKLEQESEEQKKKTLEKVVQKDR